MRAKLLLTFSLICTHVHAADVDWPSASCSGTLQACLNAAAAGDQINIRTQATILEDLTINKSVRLAADGTAARFGSGRTITITAANDGDDIALENLWLSGPVSVTMGSNNAAHTQSVSLNNMRIETAAASGSAVSFGRIGTTTSTCNVTVSRSFISGRATGSAAVQVLAGTSGSALVNVFNNQISSVYDGIAVNLSAGRANILSNRIGRGLPASESAAAVFAISVEGRGSLSATPFVQVARNETFNYSVGVFANAISAPLDTRVLNNTFAHNTLTAIDLRRTGATPPTHIGRVANNLIAGAACGLGFNNTAVAVTADYNFYQALSPICNGATPGANDRAGTPQFVAAYNFRTRASSPNVDVGNNADQPSFIGPSPDFDNRNGRVNGTVDIGAHEFSIDVSFSHLSTAANTPDLSTISQTPIALFRSDVLQLGQFGRDFDSTPSLIPNLAAHLGLWFAPSTNRWTIFNQNVFSSVALQRRFFVLLNQDSNNNLLHVANGANSSFNVTTLDHPQLNGQASALPIVTQHWDPDGDTTGTYNNTAVGLWYDSTVSRWKLFNQAPVGGIAPAMPVGAAFNVLIPNFFALGAHAFRTSPLGVPVQILNVDHPLLNNTECAHPYVSAIYNPNSVYVPANMVMSYNPNPDGRGNWAMGCKFPPVRLFTSM